MARQSKTNTIGRPISLLFAQNTDSESSWGTSALVYLRSRFRFHCSQLSASPSGVVTTRPAIRAREGLPAAAPAASAVVGSGGSGGTGGTTDGGTGGVGGAPTDGGTGGVGGATGGVGGGTGGVGRQDGGSGGKGGAGR